MNARSALGDCCQKHDPRTAPVVYPYKVAMVGDDNLRAEYRCACGNDWSCWWNPDGRGWTAEYIEHYNEANPNRDVEQVRAEWFHRGPCHACNRCDANGCYVLSDGFNPELHICANGCYGLPPGLERAA